MKTSIVRICSAVAINIKGGRPLCASPSSDHLVSYNCYFYGSFKPGFIVRRSLQRGVALGAEVGVARPRGAPLRAPARAPRGPTCRGAGWVLMEMWPGDVVRRWDIAAELPPFRGGATATRGAGIQQNQAVKTCPLAVQRPPS